MEKASLCQVVAAAVGRRSRTPRPSRDGCLPCRRGGKCLERESDDTRSAVQVVDAEMNGKIQRVIAGVQRNRHDVVRLLDDEKIQLPGKFSEIRELPRDGRPLVIVTDFEPDDILAILMMRHRRPGPLPVVIQIVDLSWKDKGGIRAKKIVLAATALGRTFAERLVVLDGTCQDEAEMCKVKRQLHEQLEASKGVAPEWVFLAPGRGHLASLMRDAEQAPCHIYSGSFNTRLPQMTGSDIEAIRRVAMPMHDSAQFVFTKDFDGMKSLNQLWPGIGKDIMKWNSPWAEAWRQFSQEFDAMLINPGHPGLFFKPDEDADPLTPEERFHFDTEVAPLFGDPSAPDAQTQRYAKALVDSRYFEKVVGFKKPTALALATNTIDGPFCDVLVPISEWLRSDAHNVPDVELKTGLWSLDPQKGFTKILAPDTPMMAPQFVDAPWLGLCEGTTVELRNPASDADKIKLELRAAVNAMMAIS